MVTPAASVDGLYFDQDRVTVVRGRPADPSRIGEFMATADAARVLGIRLGQTMRLGEYTAAETVEPGMGTPSVKPHLVVEARLVGVVVINTDVVSDDVDRYPSSWRTARSPRARTTDRCCAPSAPARE